MFITVLFVAYVHTCRTSAQNCIQSITSEASLGSITEKAERRSDGSYPVHCLQHLLSSPILHHSFVYQIISFCGMSEHLWYLEKTLPVRPGDRKCRRRVHEHPRWRSNFHICGKRVWVSQITTIYMYSSLLSTPDSRQNTN